MALIKCNECGKEISDQAEVCPNCGAKTKTGEIIQTNKIEQAQLSGKAIGLIIGVIGGAIAFFWALFTMLSDISNYGRGWGYHGYNYKSPLTQHEQIVIMWLFIGVALLIISFVQSRGLIKETNALKELHQRRMEKATNPTYQKQPWTCIDCGQSNNSIYNSCQHCGSPRPRNTLQKTTAVTNTQTSSTNSDTATVDSPPSVSKSKFCSNCGEKLQEGVKFCPSCGKPTGNGASSNTSSQEDYIGQAREFARKAANSALQKGTEAVGKAKDYIDSKRQ